MDPGAEIQIDVWVWWSRGKKKSRRTNLIWHNLHISYVRFDLIPSIVGTDVYLEQREETGTIQPLQWCHSYIKSQSNGNKWSLDLKFTVRTRRLYPGMYSMDVQYVQHIHLRLWSFHNIHWNHGKLVEKEEKREFHFQSRRMRCYQCSIICILCTLRTRPRRIL